MKRTLAGFVLVTLLAFTGGATVGYQFNKPVVAYHVVVEADHTLCSQRIRVLESQRDSLLKTLDYNLAEWNSLSLRYAELELEKGNLAFKVSVYKAMTGVDIQVTSELVR